MEVCHADRPCAAVGFKSHDHVQGPKREEEGVAPGPVIWNNSTVTVEHGVQPGGNSYDGCVGLLAVALQTDATQQTP